MSEEDKYDDRCFRCGDYYTIVPTDNGKYHVRRCLTCCGIATRIIKELKRAFRLGLTYKQDDLYRGL